MYTSKKLVGLEINAIYLQKIRM